MTEKTLETRLGWLAGIIDGEGWVGFGLEYHTRHAVARKHHKHDSARWNIEICNTNYDILAEIVAIANLLGVRAQYFPRHAVHPKRKTQGRVAFKSKPACTAILQAVLPYLVGKRAQAELMLRALEHRRISGSGHHRRSVMPIPEWRPASEDAAYLAMADEVKRLNRRGVAPTEE